MPSTATITAFYNFSANTKARASQVNGNFDIFRGHLIAINPLTATASNNTYDLGSTEYRWANVYAVNHQFGTTTTSWNIVDSTTTNDYLNFTQNGTTKFAIAKNTGATSSAGIGAFSYSPIISDFNSGSSTTGFSIQVTGSTTTITTIGRPVICGIGSFDATSSGSFIQIARGLSSGQYGATFDILRNGTVISQNLYQFSGNTTTVQGFVQFAASLNVIDFPSSGSNIYSLRITPLANSSGRIVHARTFAFEI